MAAGCHVVAVDGGMCPLWDGHDPCVQVSSSPIVDLGSNDTILDRGTLDVQTLIVGGISVL